MNTAAPACRKASRTCIPPWRRADRGGRALARKPVLPQTGDGAAFADRIDAVIWFSDLRGFTRITDSAPEQIIPLLNDYADVIVSAIHGQGGDVLKLIGDGVLAIFAAADRARACAAALAAATVAPAHLAQDSRTAARDRRTAATPTLAFGHPYVTRSGPKAPGRSRRPQGASTCA